MNLFNGEFLILNKGGLVKDIIPNTVVQNGQVRFYESVFQHLDGAPKQMGNIQIGLIDEVPAYGDLLVNITTEPTTQGGYARVNLSPSSANWTVDSINGEGRVTSIPVTWTAVGANYSRAVSRFMLLEQTGDLLTYSSPLLIPVLLLTGQSIQVQYRMYKK